MCSGAGFDIAPMFAIDSDRLQKQVLHLRFFGRSQVSVKLRLARHGLKKRPFYRIVAADKECRRDGRFIEVLGTYSPKSDPPAVTLKEDRVRRWIENGAKPTLAVANLIDKQMPGLLKQKEEAQRVKIRERRRKRKARAPQKADQPGAKKPSRKK